MSILIPCPNCGPRPVEEFSFGEIPDVPETITDGESRDFDRAFMHNNIEGMQAERWFHTFGCRRWCTVKRDTRTDEILNE